MNNRKKAVLPLRQLALAFMASAAVSYVQAQQAPAPASTPADAPSANVAIERVPAAPAAEDVIEMSPFEVTSDATGYYQASSMSGTRFNTKIEDLASAISVVTKEQMSDFAMVDINDIFMYTTGTEGTGTYTSYTVDRNGSVQDDVQLNPANANRIRGVGAANVSLGNMETMGRNPIDSMFIESVEISRGPNASVFGLGQASGTVNMVPASANLTRERMRVELRGDSYGGYRAGVDVNQVIIKSKLAFRFIGLGEHQAFIRKPSGVNVTRLAGMLKYQPFKSTTISASMNFYRMNGNRPNFTPPRDNISYWKEAGMPTWDPITQMVHIGAKTEGPYTSSTPTYFTNSFTGSTHSVAFIDQAGLGHWSVQSSTVNVWPLFSPSLGTNTPAKNTDFRRLLSPVGDAGLTQGRYTNQPLFTTTPTVSDGSIYDFRGVNYASINRAMDRVITSNLQLDQVFLNTQRHQLVAQLAFMREDSWRYTRNIIGAANDNGASGQLFVDVNERLMNGEANPYFLRPYIGTDQPRTTWEPQKWDTYRAQLMYRLDFSGNQGWTKWLGTHSINGYNEYKYRIRKRYSYRDAMNTDPKAANGLSLIPGGVSRGNQGKISGGAQAAPQLTRMYYRYYLGDNDGFNIDYSPTEFEYGMYDFWWGGKLGMNSTPIGIGQVAVTDATGAGSNLKTILKTRGGLIHSNWAKGLVTTTFGLREDEQYSKAGSGPQQLLIDGMTFDMGTIDHWAPGPWKSYSGKTKQSGAVVRPFRDLPFVTNMKNRQGAVGFLGDVLKGLAVTVNKSDSFLPMDPKVNVYLQPLPNTTGEGKDRGLILNLFDNRMVVRYNHYETKQINAQNGDASTIAGRTVRFDVLDDKDYRLPKIMKTWLDEDPQYASWTDEQKSQKISAEMGMDHERRLALEAAYRAGTIASTNDITSKGDELEIYYNPTRYWTISANATKTEAISSNVSQDIAQYIAERMPYWKAVHTNFDPTQPLWWDTKYGTNSQTVVQNYNQFVDTPYAVVREEDGKSKPQIRKYAFKVSTSLQLAGVTDHKFLKKFSIGGAIRWEDRGAIGYYGNQDANGVYVSLDATRPIYDKSHLYLDLFGSYKTKIWSDKVPMTLKLNVRNLTESGSLRPIGAFPDGTPHTYRIIDPRQFILTASFDL